MGDQPEASRERGQHVLLDPNRLQEVTNSLVTSPEFQATLSRILSGASPAPGPPGAIPTSRNATSSSVASGPTRPNFTANNDGINDGTSRSVQLQLNSSSVGNAQLEMSHLFNRGRGQRLLSGALMTRPPQRTLSRDSTRAMFSSSARSNRPRSSNRKPPYILKEVILLDKADTKAILRAGAKADLMEKGKT